MRRVSYAARALQERSSVADGGDALMTARDGGRSGLDGASDAGPLIGFDAAACVIDHPGT
jgi:hypothetical protein